MWRKSKDEEERLLTGPSDKTPESMTGPWKLVHQLLFASERTGPIGKELCEAKPGKPDSLKGEIMVIKA